jgi:hypothetical protein
MRKSAQEPFWHFGYWDFKGHGVSLFHCISKPQNAKCEKAPRSHFGISATRTSKDTGSLSSTAFRNPETQNAKKHPRAISTFRLPGLQRTWGLSLPLHFETPKREMRKSAQEPFQHFGYRDFKGHGVSLFHCISKSRNGK